uniref:Uncharacterized protein n=1 Tax=Siphoviridae sp. ctf8W5 TaxID=2825595 RepID=A0A8S5Q8B7_9CAUD|nr:MAG TPA: hypothetical protein [Siphoviridae sp. ctf8W5]
MRRKKHCKKIFIFLIILHIKYEDKRTRKGARKRYPHNARI